MASPTVSEVKGILMLLRPCDCEIEANRSPTDPSIPMMSFGLELPKFLKRFMAVDPSPAGSALKLTTGAVPSKMFADVAVKVAFANVIGLPPVPAITLRLAPTSAVMLTLKDPNRLGPEIRLLSDVLP